MGLRGMVADVQALIDDDDVDLHAEAAGWIIFLRQAYEFALLAAAVLAAYLIVEHGAWASALSWLIWLWFAVDYSVRLYVSDDRAEYIRGHRLELLAALPLDFFRPLRLLRVLRPLAMLVRATSGIRDVLGLTGFALIGSIGVTVVLLGGAVFAWVEPETAPSFSDGLWWSVVTTTTVGYGDISPATTGGRIIAGFLMVTGIGLLGAVTGEVAERLTLKAAGTPETSGDPEVDHVIQRLGAWRDLAASERVRLASMLTVLAEEGGGQSVARQNEGNN